jgi:hypothetical protein
MSIITKSSPIAKDAPITFTLDKAALAALPVVVASAWYGDSANWKKVLINYKSTTDNERIIVQFDATQATPSSTFLAISPSKDVFEVSSIYIIDFNQGALSVPASSLDQAEFVVDFADEPSFPVIRDFNSPNTVQPYESGANYVISGGLLVATGPSSYDNQDSDIAYVQGVSYTVRFHLAAYNGFGDLVVYVSNYKDQTTQAVLSASIGSTFDVSFVANAGDASSLTKLFLITSVNTNMSFSKIEFIQNP